MHTHAGMFFVILVSFLPPSLALANEAAQKRMQDRSVSEARSSMRSLQSSSEALRVRGLVAQRPVLGVLLGENETYVKILGVTPQGPAAEAGVRSRDLLASIGNKPIPGATSAERLEGARAMLTGLDTDRQISLGLVRAGKPISATVRPRVSSTISLIDNLELVPEETRQIILRNAPSAAAHADGSGAQARQMLVDVIRGQTLAPCHGSDCRENLLNEALRWNSLNLMALEPQLGRYFGSEQGVLVLGKESLPPLQAGDVILRIEGQPVATPLEALRAMTTINPGELAELEILRDRKRQQLMVTVPEQLLPTTGLAPL